MALVSYSDSECSDSESTPGTQIFEKKKGTAPGTIASTREPSKPTFQADRRNPRKIFVSLPDTDKPTKSDTQGNGSDNDDDGDGPAKKRLRIGAQGGGAFSGFNSLLPAPKRKGKVEPDNKGDGTTVPSRKVFSLKTGAEPAFDRRADAQMKWDLSNGADAGTIGEEVSSGVDVTFGSRISHGSDGHGDGITASGKEKAEEPGVKPKGNAMMFKPLSVARTTKQRRGRTTVVPQPQAMDGDGGQFPTSGVSKATTAGDQKAEENASKPVPKPKVNLFGLGKEEHQGASVSQASSTTYIPLVYNTPSEPKPQTVPHIEPSALPPPPAPSSAEQPQQHQTLATIADDLNLTRAEKRQLFGRQGFSSSSSNAPDAKQSNPNVITFNTDQEYSSNNAFLLSASDAELAAQQHNPVRSIAPGKHSLQQLVNAVSNQREALEESFAIGKRNKKEAGNKYGW
ncbi:hypothetical protein AJ78_02722 [Emergomyces pasteurianus Ep9510]|uniref:Mitotic checkpoint regulator, MAD2B-interacting-domain-containing protein n=1 Tax=Emergomyces pasteurianus Ep9510 TaxID=1447872 RepID=A0A1J9PMS9_9EURO|nr:hypothetical protein AJ78_02722 [Emergomyces pasteurianus Ep9510]